MRKEWKISFEDAIADPDILLYLMVSFNNFRVGADFGLYLDYGIGNGHELITEFARRILVDGERFYGKEKSGQ